VRVDLGDVVCPHTLHLARQWVRHRLHIAYLGGIELFDKGEDLCEAPGVFRHFLLGDCEPRQVSDFGNVFGF
jgi:hypothetical protein